MEGMSNMDGDNSPFWSKETDDYWRNLMVRYDGFGEVPRPKQPEGEQDE